MKKIFIVIMSLLMVFACNPKKDVFMEQVKKDYAEAVTENEHAYFYEVEAVLDKPVSKIDKGLNIISTKTIIQVDSFKVKEITRDFKKGKVVSENVEYLDGIWIGDLKIQPDSIELNFSDAVKRLKETNTILPDGDKMTFRCPIAPPFRPVYIFGTMGTFFVSVDAVDGKVETFDGGISKLE